jgi:lysozyme family protein
MVAATYEESLRRLLAAEGGYTNHPSDPGGPTNFGITLADFRRHARPGATAADIRAMKVEEAKAIYRVHYWNAVRCDELPAGVDYCVFDYAVNSGTTRAAKVLQRVLARPATGRVDAETLRLARAGDARKIIAAICDERLRFLRGLKTWPVFGTGWSRRVQSVRVAALAMASHGAAVPQPAKPAPLKPPPDAPPMQPNPEPTGVIAAILRALAALFGRR